MSIKKADTDKVRVPAEMERGNPPWNWFEAVCVATLAIIGSDVLLSLLIFGLARLLKGSELDISNALKSGSIALNFGYYALSRLLGFGLIAAFIHRRGVDLHKFGFRRFDLKKGLVTLGIALVLMIVGTVVVFALLSLIDPSLNLNQAQDVVFTKATAKPEIVLAFIALIIIAPIMEESVFRGLMLPAFAKSFGIVAAAVITSVLFGLVHWQLNVGIVTFILGLLLAWVYYRTRSLWPAIMLHSLKNLIAFVLIFYK